VKQFDFGQNKTLKQLRNVFSCFSQSQSVPAVCAPRHKQRIPTVIG